MYSDSFMKFLYNYQKNEFEPEKNVKEINFKKGGGKLIRVTVSIDNFNQ